MAVRFVGSGLGKPACIYPFLPRSVLQVGRKGETPFASFLPSRRLQLSAQCYLFSSTLCFLWLHAQLSHRPSSIIICCLEQNLLIKEAVWKGVHPEGLEPSTEKSGTHVPRCHLSRATLLSPRPTSYFSLSLP